MPSFSPCKSKAQIVWNYITCFQLWFVGSPDLRRLLQPYLTCFTKYLKHQQMELWKFLSVHESLCMCPRSSIKVKEICLLQFISQEKSATNLHLHWGCKRKALWRNSDSMSRLETVRGCALTFCCCLCLSFRFSSDLERLVLDWAKIWKSNS